ncbi:MAG: Clp1/GlmU family protein, partial [Arenicellales bacterium]|nr:Clp1/GlmU family protein [Arenicellales bacterium]
MTVLTCSPGPIIQTVCEQDRRLLLFGPPGIGKSTLASQLAHVLSTANRECWCVSADPGLPGFGVPGAITLGKWEADDWHAKEYVALCTLDAGRFRLPLVSAVQSLTQYLLNGMFLIDGPGVVRGVAGRELLTGIVEATNADAVLALTAPDRSPPLLDELRALNLDVFLVHAAAGAKRPGKRIRARLRTAKWDAYLTKSVEQKFDLRKTNVIGTPPPIDETSVWVGRQVGLLRHNQTLTMGEVKRLDGELLTVVLPEHVADTDTILVRDALRTVDSLIETAAPFLSEPIKYLPPVDVLPGIEQSSGPRVVARVGQVDVSLPNGVFGDPHLHLRLRHQGRSLLFDLGDGARLPARLAHQVTDVFISHAHMDHISGFNWFLRSRLGEPAACHLYGPPGLVKHIEGFIQCYLWDRIGDQGPVFEVAELYDDHLRRYRIQPGGPPCERKDDLPVVDGVLHEEVGFRVRAAV